MFGTAPRRSRAKLSNAPRPAPIAAVFPLAIVRPRQNSVSPNPHCVQGNIEMANPTKGSYVRGSQDIRQNKETYELFWSLTKYNLIGIGLLMIVLAYFFT
jgi:hypothetical protein